MPRSWIDKPWNTRKSWEIYYRNGKTFGKCTFFSCILRKIVRTVICCWSHTIIAWRLSRVDLLRIAFLGNKNLNVVLIMGWNFVFYLIVSFRSGLDRLVIKNIPVHVSQTPKSYSYWKHLNWFFDSLCHINTRLKNVIYRCVYSSIYGQSSVTLMWLFFVPSHNVRNGRVERCVLLADWTQVGVSTILLFDYIVRPDSMFHYRHYRTTGTKEWQEVQRRTRHKETEKLRRRPWIKPRCQWTLDQSGNVVSSQIFNGCSMQWI